MAMANPAKILVVDDDPQIFTLVKLVSRRFDFDLAYCSNGYEALSYIHKNDCDLILLDLQMPGMDGFEFLQRLRSLRRNLPVIIFTAMPLSFETKLRLKQEVRTIIEKPVHLSRLVLEVLNHLPSAIKITSNTSGTNRQVYFE